MYYNLLLFRFPAGSGVDVETKEEVDAGVGGDVETKAAGAGSDAKTKDISTPSERENKKKVNILFSLFFGS